MEKFPSLRGLSIESSKTPRFGNRIARSANGHETRTSLQSTPLWDFEISFNFLANRRDGYQDLETIENFFLARRGSFESFLYENDETPFEEGITLGVGDGVNQDFTLIQSAGSLQFTAGGVLNAADVLVYQDSVLMTSGYTLEDHRTVRITTPPALGVTLTADYKPLYRVRFAEDQQSYERFMSQLWELNQVQLVGVFL